ncbi:MAG: hypothetical protein KBT48_10045 [Firmicutes bacterium]|nr:hypothetical protein [Bacillota bacterium]
MNRFKIFGILFYMAGICFVIATIIHYKQGGMADAIFPIVYGSLSFCFGSMSFYLSIKK